MSLQPLWVRSMRTGVVSRRMGKTGASGEQFGPHTQGVVGGMSGAEHPLVAAHAAHAAAHLVGESLEGERLISGGQRAGDGGIAAALGLRGEKEIDRLFEAPLEQIGISGKGNGCGRSGGGTQRNVKSMDGVEKEERPHAFVQVVAGAAEAVQRLALGEQLIERQVAADGIQRTVALLAARRDHGDEPAHWRVPPAVARNSRSARSSRIWESTCARSCPLRARANWATSRP